VFAIDEDTALLLDEGRARVAGKGSARLFDADDEAVYASGQRFTV
jgi:cyanophycinase-like exopeptidase